MQISRVAFALCWLVVGFVFAVGPAFARTPATSAAKDKQAKKAPPSPVTGKPADEKVFVAYKGGKVFFDSEQSKATFEKSPATYAVQANYQLFLTGQARQVRCPILGKPLRGTSFHVGGIYVCCGGCQRKLAAASGQQQMAHVFGTEFDKTFVVGSGK